jgi:hypothetical protein
MRKMAKSPSLDKLVSSAAAKADVEISSDDLSRIRTCRPDSDLAEWIERSLRPERLLSSEEVRLAVHCDEVGGDLGPGVVPLREEELLHAIADLEAETEVLNRQAEVLEAQRARVERRGGTMRTGRGRVFALQIQERNLAATRRLEGEILQAREEVEALLRVNGESVERVVGVIPATVTRLLNGHDRVLEGVKKGDLAGGETELATSVSIETVERLAGTLARIVAEELQVRLDRIYLESLHGGLNNDKGDGAGLQTAEEAAVLEQDLESLYAEIPDVAAMYVAQKYSEPLLRAVREEERQRRAVAAARSHRVTGLLADLTLELEGLAERLRTFHSYRCVMRDLRNGYEQFDVSDRREGLGLANATASPPREFGEVMEGLLRHFGIPTTATRDSLEVVDEKVARLQESTRQSELNASSGARKVHEARKMLVESLLNGVDHDQNGAESLSKLDELEARISRLREDVEAVSGADTSQAARRQREFVGRWA